MNLVILFVSKVKINYSYYDKVLSLSNKFSCGRNLSTAKTKVYSLTLSWATSIPIIHHPKIHREIIILAAFRCFSGDFQTGYRTEILYALLVPHSTSLLTFQFPCLPALSICLCVSVYLYICLSVCLSAYLSTYIYLSIYLPTYLPTYLPVCMSVCLCFSLCLSIYLSVCLYVCLSIYISICVSIYLSMYDFRLPPPCWWDLRSSGILCGVVW